MTDYEIYDVSIEGVVAYLGELDREPRFRFTINWTGDKGFGEIAVINKPSTNEFFIDSEFMGRDFVKAVLCKLVDNSYIRGEENCKE